VVEFSFLQRRQIDAIDLDQRAPQGFRSGTIQYAGDLLEVVKPDGTKALIPFEPGIADLGEGSVSVDPEFLA